MNRPEKYKASSDLNSVLVTASRGFLKPENFDRLVTSIEGEAAKYYFDNFAEANLIRMVNSLFDPVSFLSDALHYPHHIEIVVAIAANSNYLTDIVVRNPEFLYQLFDTDFLEREIIFDELYHETQAGIKKYKSFAARVNYLRSTKRRLMLKIGLTDILGIFPLIKITHQITVLARVICASLLDLCIYKVAEKYNYTPTLPKYVLCSLGKMGGDELNYSSDVDFILFYDKNEIVGENSTEYYDILNEATQLFIKEATEKTERGFLYRVDFRLRPDGLNSPLCRTLPDYIKYYEVKGEDWERQMLLKLGFVSGNDELYEQFRNFIRGFIFPSVYLQSPIEQIRKMRKKIEDRSAGEDNIKTFRGGIRDIEFSVQALQLIGGKKYREIVTGNSLIAIKAMLGKGILNEDEHNIYTEAYIFYRKVEHYLQLMNDNQTHVIPVKGDIPPKLAAFLGFENEDSFRHALELKRNNVRKIYNSIMDIEVEEEHVVDVFVEIKFSDYRSAEKNLQFLATGKGLLGEKNFDKKTIDLYTEIKQTLASYLHGNTRPDAVLAEFTKFMQTVRFHSIWYGEFRNREYFETILKICDYAAIGSSYFRHDKSLGEMLLTRKVFVQNVFEYYNELSLNQILYMLSVQFALKLIKNTHFSGYLTGYLNNVLQRKIEQFDFEYDYFIVALGSSATDDMHFGSDFDLIVVARNIEKHPDIFNHFQQFLNSIKQELAPFEVDFRLRPEGKNSPIVTDIEAFKKYLEKRAQIWEFQAFQKMRFVSGNINMYDELVSSIINRIKDFDGEKLKLEIKGMHKKFTAQATSGFTKRTDLKKSRGTLVTIDFLLQYLFLVNPEIACNALAKSTPERIMLLAKLIPEYKDITKLIDAYNFYKYLEISNQNLFNQRSSVLPTENTKQEKLAVFAGYNSYAELEKELKATQKIVYKYFEQFLG